MADHTRATNDVPDIAMFGPADFEQIRTAIPGPQSLRYAASLSRYEAQGVTYFADDFPVFWESVSGATITDADGNRYIDLSGAFGVAAVGHANPVVMAAIAQQAQHMPHGMGDVHPSSIRARLLEKLAALAPGNLEKTFLGLNGADAIEFARKTAYLATGKPATLAFRGGYHGLSYGTLELAGIEKFRTPFEAQLCNDTVFLDYPMAGSVSLTDALVDVERAFVAHTDIGAIIIEPIAGRAGTLVPPTGYLQALCELARAHSVIVIFDEIYTGFGRTGTYFACDHEHAIPDILCLGKAIGGGFPLSAAIGSARVFDAWPKSRGEAIHTATFLGNPMACAAALAVIDEIERHDLMRRAADLGTMLTARLGVAMQELRSHGLIPRETRGRGLMQAIDLADTTLAVRATVAAMRKGVIVLPQGSRSDALAITPPLVISIRQLERAMDIVVSAIIEAASD